MDPNAVSFLTSLAAGVGANLASAATIAAFRKILRSRPDIESRLLRPASPEDFQAALRDLGGELEFFAGTGAITIDKALITALRSAHFDHQQGMVAIGNARVSAPVVEMGGSGTGQTVISSNTELCSAGTSIKVGDGASIIVTGNAKIKQT